MRVVSPVPKRISSAESARLEAIQKIARDNWREKPSYDHRQDAAKFLSHHYAVDVVEGADPLLFWPLVKAAEPRFLVRNAHQRYREALAYAFAIFECVINSGDQLERHLYYIYEGENPRRNPDILLAILRAVIKYGNGWRGDASRDAQAIRYLISQNIGPHEVETFYAARGGGVDAWSRAYSRLTKASETTVAGEEDAAPMEIPAGPQRLRTAYTPQSWRAKFSLDENCVSVDMDAILPGDAWAFVLVRDDKGVRIADAGRLGVYEHGKGYATEALIRIASTFFSQKTPV